MNITLTGNLGSGKTSVCKELEKKGFEIISAGGIFREVAKDKGVSVIELNEMAKKDRSIDDLIDERSTRLGKEKDNTVFDSRLAWNFIPDSFKVFLIVKTDEAARRVFDGASRDAEEYKTKEEAAEGLKVRAGLEKQRFKDLYNINYYYKNNYNLIIESTSATPAAIADKLVECFEAYKENAFVGKMLLNDGEGGFYEYDKDEKPGDNFMIDMVE